MSKPSRSPLKLNSRRPEAASACWRRLVLCTFLLLFPVSAQAQQRITLVHQEWEVSVYTGGSFLGSGTYSTPVEGLSQPSSRSVGLRYGTGLVLGARVTGNQWEHWSETIEYGFSNQPLTLTNLSDSVQELGLGHAIHRFAYEIAYYPRDRYERLRPFVFVGPGVSLFYIKGSAKEAAAAQGIHGLSDPWKFTLNWGGGVKYQFAQGVGASLQFSDSISGVPAYGLPKTGKVGPGGYVPGFQPDGLMNNWMIGIGFVYQWGESQ